MRAHDLCVHACENELGSVDNEVWRERIEQPHHDEEVSAVFTNALCEHVC